VVDVRAGILGPERDGLGLPRRSHRSLRAAAGAVNGMEIDVVGHGAGRQVLQRELDRVAPPDPNHGTRHLPAEGHVGELDAGFDFGRHLFARQRDVVRAG
jgi:hypothetical protein